MLKVCDQACNFDTSLEMRHVKAMKVKSLQIGDIMIIHFLIANGFSMAGVEINEGRQPHSLSVPRTRKFHLMEKASLAWVSYVVDERVDVDQRRPDLSLIPLMCQPILILGVLADLMVDIVGLDLDL